MGDLDVTQDFLAWGRLVVNEAAVRLEGEIADAHRGAESHLKGYEARYVHFRDAKLPQHLAVWLFAVAEGTANNVRDGHDAIGVGLKHDADGELDQGAWRFRRLGPFTWQTQIDARYAGFRWMRNADTLPPDPAAAADEIAEQVLRTLRRADAVATGDA